MSDRTYRIHVAAELAGVRVELIRAWERRYGILQPRRTPAGYRVYTERDVALLRRLRQLTEEGVAISEAATLLPRLEAEVDAAAQGRAVESTRRREGFKEQLLLATEASDQGLLSAAVDELLAALPPLRAFDEVLVPFVREVGERWQRAQLSVAQEHLASQVVRARLVGLLHAAPQGGARHALLACFPDEQHEMGLLGAALRLKHLGFRVTLLGQRTPIDEALRLAAALRPELLGLSAVMSPGPAAFAEVVEALRAGLPPGVRVWMGGAAALVHAPLATAAGFSVYQGLEDWARLGQ